MCSSPKWWFVEAASRSRLHGRDSVCQDHSVLPPSHTHSLAVKQNTHTHTHTHTHIYSPIYIFCDLLNTQWRIIAEDRMCWLIFSNITFFRSVIHCGENIQVLYLYSRPIGTKLMQVYTFRFQIQKNFIIIQCSMAVLHCMSHFN